MFCDPEPALGFLTPILEFWPGLASERELRAVAERIVNYSGADIKALCQEAAMGPIRDLLGS